MTAMIESIEAAAMKLSKRDRIHLAHRLAESVTHISPEIERAWLDEVERRVSEIDAGVGELIPGDQVIRELRAKYPERHRRPR